MNNLELYERAKQLIPGGTQLLSKRPELYAPDVWPAYFREAKGCEIVDLDGRRLIDMSNNCVGACLLGYANERVDQAVLRRIQSGSICSLNSPDEVALAELLIELHPWSEMVRYARTGGEALAIAVRIARAAKRRDGVAFCGYHGWSDWYVAANLTGDRLGEHLLPGLDPNGIPQGLMGTVFPFRYGQLDELFDIVRDQSLAAIVMEPLRSHFPEKEFLDGVRQLADDHDIALIVDEVSAGWKFHCGGAHLRLGLEPDIAVFSKSTSNGYPMSVVIGKGNVMDAAQSSFISSTYWTDGVGPAAALATIGEMKKQNIPVHLEKIGRQVMDLWTELGQEFEVPTRASGLPQFAALGFAHRQQSELQTLFTIGMLKSGFLAASSFYPTIAHQPNHVDSFRKAASKVFVELRAAIASGDVASHLNTPVRQQGFQRLTT